MLKPSHLELRLLILAACLLGIGYWIPRHSGWESIWGPALAVGGAVVATMTTLVGLLEKKQSDASKEVARGFVQGLIFRAVRRRILVPLAILVGLVVTIFTSVTVRADAVSKDTAVTLTIGRQDWHRTLTPGNPSVSISWLPTLFGRTATLKVDGRLAKTVDVAFWSGAVVHVDDLAPTPVVLVRVPHGKHHSIGGGKFTVELGAKPQPPVRNEGGSASLMIGPRRAIPATAEATWRLELAANKEQAATTARSILRWSDPLHVDLEVLPGARLEVECRTRDGVVLAARAFVVGREPFQDVLLTERKNP